MGNSKEFWTTAINFFRLVRKLNDRVLAQKENHISVIYEYFSKIPYAMQNKINGI